jgi:hypothetical protein
MWATTTFSEAATWDFSREALDRAHGVLSETAQHGNEPKAVGVALFGAWKRPQWRRWRAAWQTATTRTPEQFPN